MNFLKKLFGGSDKTEATHFEKDPDNTRLIYLLNIYGDHRSQENYKAVLDEIMTGNSYLILPSSNKENNTHQWKKAEDGTTIGLTSVFNIDGLKVLGAFSDQSSLVKWTNRKTQYTAIKTQDLVDFCKTNHFDRIVINSDQKNMFVLER